MIPFKFNRCRCRLALLLLIRTTRTYRPLLLCPCSPTLQFVKLPLILSLNPEEKLLIYAGDLLGLLRTPLLMLLLPVCHALNHVLILFEGFFLPAPEIPLLQES
jgi:hypothetical protein